MPKELNISEARASLPELIDGLEEGTETEITITRHGTPVATVTKYQQKSHFSLRGKSLWMSDDFNEPMEDLWREVEGT